MAESDKERVDRELLELLNELRVALPGVQVLFAFLLIVPFQQGFRDVSALQRGVYLLALGCTAAASALLIAPSSYHRLRFRQRDKKRMLFLSNRLMIAGMVLVAVGMVSSVWLITDLVVGGMAGAVTAIVATLWFGWFWYGLPLTRPSEGIDETGDDAGEAEEAEEAPGER